jgi:hypothetical protein
MIAFLISRPMKRVGLTLPPAILARQRGDRANSFVACPLRVKRVGLVMSAICPVSPEQRTFPDAYCATARLKTTPPGLISPLVADEW